MQPAGDRLLRPEERHWVMIAVPRAARLTAPGALGNISAPRARLETVAPRLAGLARPALVIVGARDRMSLPPEPRTRRGATSGEARGVVIRAMTVTFPSAIGVLLPTRAPAARRSGPARRG